MSSAGLYIVKGSSTFDSSIGLGGNAALLCNAKAFWLTSTKLKLFCFKATWPFFLKLTKPYIRSDLDVQIVVGEKKNQCVALFYFDVKRTTNHAKSRWCLRMFWIEVMLMLQWHSLILIFPLKCWCCKFSSWNVSHLLPIVLLNLIKLIKHDW